MPAPWRRGGQDRVEYVVVERNGEEQAAAVDVGDPTPSVDRILRRSYTRRQAPSPTPTDDDYESDDDDYDGSTPPVRIAATATGAPTFLITIPSKSNPTVTALADEDPTETVVVTIQPPPPPPPPKPHHDRDGKISQTTEHLLIAAGSIGATIIIVMIILALYTMRKRGLTIRDVIMKGKDSMRRRGAPPPPPKYAMDNKQAYNDDYNVYPPRTAAVSSRSGSLSTQTPLQPLGRSDSFNLNGLEHKDSMKRSFLLDAAPSHQPSHRRNQSETPSSAVLPIQDVRRSASTRNTRSMTGDEEALHYSDAPPPGQLSALPAPPTFRQFLSNRPSASQRPGLGGAMMSRFSWTNSNAPQTPHDPSRDTAIAAPIGRDSFMTQRSSVPRFRTIDSWVNQQSNRVEEQRLKQQFRMTQSSTYSGEGDSGEDEVPEMPAVPKNLSRSASTNGKTAPGLPGKDVKHARHDTRTTIETAPIFKQHPGTEVRFSTRSMVPSEVLDMGRKNVAL
ncbi:hypothetical protein EK21DRAFT_88299 [Setomelanomma holmii]|uniref:Uncharacterized protein n=1 Tax=Setomelanomma holmii TaxID=210430 RepID=A0A9P4HD58_9PLEO|nr:hypothetical protein EK21DRAFT_88299 [Setomelanomma holmii]